MEESRNRKPDYIFNVSEEITEEEIADVPEAEKKLFRYFIEHNPEKKIIEIRPGNGDCIELHGAHEVKDFVKTIQDYSREVF
ncbi:MAG: hypothetical protein HFH68_05275 [Lachnospiraceae bacterium]|nr:hypothetical protein [Lachnospiraceae bacterium]